MKFLRATLLVAISLALCLGQTAATDGAAKPQTTVAGGESKPLARIAVIGASMSSGFGVRVATTLDDGKKVSEGVDLAALVKIACKDPSVLLANYATSLYFMNPAATARSSAARALSANPTCVLAVDWIFWNGYGVSNVKGERLTKDEERMALLENALQCLQPLCASNIPIVLGDFPDMHSAIGGGMISAPMVPSVECLAALNKRVAEWAQDKPNVCLLPLSQLTTDLAAKKPIKAAGREWTIEKLGPMLQKDRLHPTFAGTVTVLAVALDALDRLTANAALANFEIDPAVLRERFVKKLQMEAAPSAVTATVPTPTKTDSKDPPAGASAPDPSPSGSSSAAPSGRDPR
ncbi:MAG: hypothetical protein K8R92_08380 [Planctomycetes bacterium]|nr:hypothetical protein [Planctomycetota bacterium]